MRAVRQFNVVPAIPPRLAALGSLANNIHWTWDRHTQALFAQLDPDAVGVQRPRSAAPDRRDHRRPVGRTRRPIPRSRRSPTPRPTGWPRPTTEPRWFQSRGRQPARARRLLLPRVRAHRDAAAVLAAVSASWPATTSRRPRISGCRSSPSACCTPRATSANGSTPTATRRSASRGSTRTVWR